MPTASSGVSCSLRGAHGGGSAAGRWGGILGPASQSGQFLPETVIKPSSHPLISSRTFPSSPSPRGEEDAAEISSEDPTRRRFGFVSLPHDGRIRSMRAIKKLSPALRKAREEGIDLSQLSERLSLTPTERIKRNFRMAQVVEELRKAGQRHRDGKRR